jgi:hypothetical protein
LIFNLPTHNSFIDDICNWGWFGSGSLGGASTKVVLFCLGFGVLLFLGAGYFNIMGSLVRLEVGP